MFKNWDWPEVLIFMFLKSAINWTQGSLCSFLHFCVTLNFTCSTDFICPTCMTMGPNAQEDCESKYFYPVCEYTDRPQCVVYKHLVGLFTRICASESKYQEELKKCKADSDCQMGRCFKSGCLATLGEN